MRKLYVLISCVIFNFSVIYSQAFIDIPLSASDGSSTIPLAVGLDTAATNGIDPGLGESDLPPMPPAGVFEFRFDLTPYTGEPLSTYYDYRPPGNPPSFPFSDTVQHRIVWQKSDPSYPIDIHYELPTNSKMVIQDEFGGVLLNLGPYEGIGTATIPGTLPITAAFIYMIYTGIIPVELTSFSADVTANGILLNWSTATETNNRGFEIQRSRKSAAGSQNWTTIGFISGNGTTTEPQQYSFTDKDILNGNYTYRLKQIDFDGTVSYSNEVMIVTGSFPADYSLSQNFPNPFNPSTSIQFTIPQDCYVTVKVYNMLGQEIATLFSGNTKTGVHTLDWDGRADNGNQVTSGSYIFRMTAGNHVQTRKAIFLK